jgi:DNA-binding response OmpR family regulator
MADVTLIRVALRERGHAGEITTIYDGEQAIRFVEAMDADSHRPLPALVILDLNLPKVHGRDVLQRFHSSGRLTGLPIVILSSSDNEQDKRIAAAMGAKRYIKKPMDLTGFMEIGRIIEAVLREIRPHNGA